MGSRKAADVIQEAMLGRVPTRCFAEFTRGLYEALVQEYVLEERSESFMQTATFCFGNWSPTSSNASLREQEVKRVCTCPEYDQFPITKQTLCQWQ